MEMTRSDDQAQNLLEVRGLRIGIPRGAGYVRLLDRLDLTVKKRQSFGIVGESGCGKSITAGALLQLLPWPLRVLEGTAHFRRPEGDLEMIGLAPDKMRDLRGNEIAMIFQESLTALDPLFTVEFQMREALTFHDRQSKSRREATEQAASMLRRMKISHPAQVLASYPHQLSGGQIQRVMIAMAMLNNPRLLIADEPTTALDVTVQAQILDLMNELKESNDTSIVMITHDLGVIAETCQEVAVLYAGQVVEQASAADLFHNAAHPYTLGLLESVNALGGPGQELHIIPGVVPPGGEWGTGCRFAGRCSRKMKKCAEAMPALTEIASGRLCRCFLQKDEVEG
ncbi:MAG: ABC transporter ATP-binding protein [Synergistaceae bacterium]|jgi:peptide/nickel transport system ATP-binding protein|nr:ABC transporter ATP-binding protein [Synergistaceae bacterium]